MSGITIVELPILFIHEVMYFDINTKYAFDLETLIYIGTLNFTNTTNFQSPEVVYRGSETQLQVPENSN